MPALRACYRHGFGRHFELGALAIRPLFSSRHGDADDIAPLADTLVGLQVDGLVFPKRAVSGGGHRRGDGMEFQQ